MSAQPRRTARPAGAQPAVRPAARRLARLPWLVGAIAMIAVAVTLSAWFGVEAWWARALVVALGLIGIGYLGWLVPTRERVLARRRGGST